MNNLAHKKKIIIYKKIEIPTQSVNRNIWFIEFDIDSCVYTEPIMNWTGIKNTETLINLQFDTKEEAIDFANNNNFEYKIVERSSDTLRRNNIKKKIYSDNFTKYSY